MAFPPHILLSQLATNIFTLYWFEELLAKNLYCALEYRAEIDKQKKSSAFIFENLSESRAIYSIKKLKIVNVCAFGL